MEEKIARLLLDVNKLKSRAEAARLDMVVHLLSMTEIEISHRFDRASMNSILADSPEEPGR